MSLRVVIFAEYVVVYAALNNDELLVSAIPAMSSDVLSVVQVKSVWQYTIFELYVSFSFILTVEAQGKVTCVPVHVGVPVTVVQFDDVNGQLKTEGEYM